MATLWLLAAVVVLVVLAVAAASYSAVMAEYIAMVGMYDPFGGLPSGHG